MSEQLYAAVMAALALITGGYLSSIGFGLHTPRFRRPIGAAALAKLRLWSKVAGVASIMLAVLYLAAALTPR